MSIGQMAFGQKDQNLFFIESLKPYKGRAINTVSSNTNATLKSYLHERFQPAENAVRRVLKTFLN
jgi:hypothetical protein